jgi:hypothetical protein
LILANRLIRVGEATRHLRWRDISSTKTLSGQKRLIFTVRGKTGEREVVCNETVERYIERLRNFRSEEAKTLRHTYATMRISEGVSVFQLAANMGTSVEMIESFYGKKRMRDPKMATEVTKFRGR